MVIKIFGHNPQVPVEKVEQLLFHEVDFGDGEAKVLVTSYGGVACPVLILWRRVVEVLGCEDERGQEDTVDSATHALGYRW